MSLHVVGKISFEHVSDFVSLNVTDGAVDIKLTLDVGNNPSKQNKK